MSNEFGHQLEKMFADYEVRTLEGGLREIKIAAFPDQFILVQEDELVEDVAQKAIQSCMVFNYKFSIYNQ
jgi:hypothetical protein